jgi:ATP-dependent Lon protease
VALAGAQPAPAAGAVPATGEAATPAVDSAAAPATQRAAPAEGHLTFKENQRGVTYDALFGPYLAGAQTITVTDPYIRLFYQARNLMELLETIARHKADEDEIAVCLVTVADDFKAEQQAQYFAQMQAAAEAIGIRFTWQYDGTGSAHARHIVTNTGWKILLDRGLDIYLQYEMNDAFTFANRLQQYRACKAFEVTYLRVT